jgi:UDP-GlcNAc3NAcA epimerase
LSAAKLNIPVAHVEAGLRSFNMRMPEEVNRIMADHVSRILLCPTEAAIQNLRNEGLQRRPEVRIEITGDVMYDAALYYRSRAIPTPEIGTWMAKHGSRGFYLATIHRAENTDDASRFREIIVALEVIGAEIPIILPLHPRTRRALSTPLRNVHCFPPVGYFDMLSLLEGCKGVLTDSGGLQKEASFFEKPCVTLRDETEWIELVQAGANVLAGANSEQIIKAERWMRSAAGAVFIRPYGNGAAGTKIASILGQEFA